MKIVVVGTRGIPNILGGVETHCEELYPRLARLGYDITLIRRSCYVSPDNKLDNYMGVKIKDIYAPKMKSIEAILHTFLSILYAKKVKADILHVHAIGPSLLVPFAKLLGLKVVITHHGPDYDRQKWGRMAKLILRLGEKMGAKFSDEVIVISKVIEDSLRIYGRGNHLHLIYNGVNRPHKTLSKDYITSLGLLDKKYIVSLGRFVEEKGFDYLINAFERAGFSEYKLVIAGDADHETSYSKHLKEEARERGVILTGFIKGEKLNELMSHAALFVLPSFHEGLPIALLEAISYRLDVLVSDIPANKQVVLPQDSFFHVGEVDELTSKLRYKLSEGVHEVRYNLAPYNWDKISSQVADVYQHLESA